MSNKEEYVRFREVPNVGGKTKVFQVEGTRGVCLGGIKWYSPWRRYTFQPDRCVVLDKTCLAVIAVKLEELMAQRKVAKSEDKI